MRTIGGSDMSDIDCRTKEPMRPRANRRFRHTRDQRK